MVRWRRADIAAGAATGVLLVATWPALSGAWIRFLEIGGVLFARGGAVSVPPSASDVLPLVLAAIVAIPGTARRKASYATVAVGLTLGAELLLVAAATMLYPPVSVMTILGGLVQNVLPLCVLIGALRDAEVIGGPPVARHA